MKSKQMQKTTYQPRILDNPESPETSRWVYADIMDSDCDGDGHSGNDFDYPTEESALQALEDYIEEYALNSEQAARWKARSVIAKVTVEYRKV